MKRLVYVDGTFGGQDKYILQEQYEGFGIYRHMTPSGYYVHQDWLITNGTITIVAPSYNDFCKEELLDFIDNFNELGTFGIKAIARGNNQYIAHNVGGKPI